MYVLFSDASCLRTASKKVKERLELSAKNLKMLSVQIAFLVVQKQYCLIGFYVVGISFRRISPAPLEPHGRRTEARQLYQSKLGHSTHTP